MGIAESATVNKGVLKEKRSVTDGGKGFLNASQISHYDMVIVLLYKWMQ